MHRVGLNSHEYAIVQGIDIAAPFLTLGAFGPLNPVTFGFWWHGVEMDRPAVDVLGQME